MSFKNSVLVLLIFFSTQILKAQEFSRAVRPYVAVQENIVALTHAKTIDGTGADIKTNQTLIFENGIITAMGNTGEVTIPAGAKVIDCTGKTIMPGMVMLHEHIFYPKPFDGIFSVSQMTFTFPRLYLAGGVTTIRTAGSIEPQTDLNIRKWIEEGRMLGPKMDLTSPFIEREGTSVPEVGVIESSDENKKNWSTVGVSSNVINASYIALKESITYKLIKSKIKSAFEK